MKVDEYYLGRKRESGEVWRGKRKLQSRAEYDQNVKYLYEMSQTVLNVWKCHNRIHSYI